MRILCFSCFFNVFECLFRVLIILVGYAQTAAVGSVLLIGSTVYTELSGRSGRLSFDRKVCLFVGCFLALRCQGDLGMQAPCEALGAETS